MSFPTPSLFSDFNIDFTKADEPTSLISDLEDFKFEFATTSDPASFVSSVKGSDSQASKLMDFSKGTTTLGFVFNEGVLIAVDSRATMGAFVGSDDVRKVIEINEYLLGTMAGGAADCSFWERFLAQQCRLYELRNGERISVAAASRIFANLVFNYRNHGLSIGSMVAGWDKTGPNLYFIDNSGTRLKGNLFSVGSGSTYAYGVLDSYYRPDLSLKEAIELGVKAIYHATYRDSASGGMVRGSYFLFIFLN